VCTGSVWTRSVRTGSVRTGSVCTGLCVQEPAKERGSKSSGRDIRPSQECEALMPAYSITVTAEREGETRPQSVGDCLPTFSPLGTSLRKQRVGPSEQTKTRVVRRLDAALRITSHKASPTMATGDPVAQVLDQDLEAPAAGWTLLEEVRRCRHRLLCDSQVPGRPKKRAAEEKVLG
jgi:hypothetical protein